MARPVLVIAALALVALAVSTSAATLAANKPGWLDAGTLANKFIVRYNVIPDLTHNFNFYEMPRTIKDARNDHFSQVAENADDHTTIWCRKGDFRVCVIFDEQGSVAGIQLSAKVSELDGSSPLDIAAIPEWRRQTFLDEDVYTATVYFLEKGKLIAGGRFLYSDDLTAPEGIYIHQSTKDGVETGRLHVANPQEYALDAGFTEQACFFGMGKHYFQELRKEGQCENHRPFFLLYGPKTQTLNGVGFVQFGKVSQGRGWFENPPALVAKIIAPNSPDCQSEWINKYGLFTMHVFFVDKPYLTRC